MCSVRQLSICTFRGELRIEEEDGTDFMLWRTIGCGDFQQCPKGGRVEL